MTAWVTRLYSRNWLNTVNQLYPNKNSLKKSPKKWSIISSSSKNHKGNIKERCNETYFVCVCVCVCVCVSVWFAGFREKLIFLRVGVKECSSEEQLLQENWEMSKYELSWLKSTVQTKRWAWRNILGTADRWQCVWSTETCRMCTSRQGPGKDHVQGVTATAQEDELRTSFTSQKSAARTENK